MLAHGSWVMLNRHFTPSKVAANLFGIDEPWKWTFIPMGGPLAHGNSLIGQNL